MISKEEKFPNDFHEWKDCETLFLHLGAKVSRKHSRLRIELNGYKGLFHCSDFNQKIDPYSIRALKKFLLYAEETK